jgi:hypothetical protein
MPQFYFHLKIGREWHSDEIGLELPTVEAAYLEAFAGAQEMWSELLAERSDPTIYSFEISDEAGECLMRVPFTEVLDRARKPPAPAGHNSTTALMSKTAGLSAALAEQIERTRRMLRETQETLRRSASQRP